MVIQNSYLNFFSSENQKNVWCSLLMNTKQNILMTKIFYCWVFTLILEKQFKTWNFEGSGQFRYLFFLWNLMETVQWEINQPKENRDKPNISKVFYSTKIIQIPIFDLKTLFHLNFVWNEFFSISSEIMFFILILKN